MSGGDGPAIDVVIQSPRWNSVPRLRPLLRRAIEAAAPDSMADAQAAIILTNDAAIRALNRRWRSRDEPTNVLSFPAAATKAATGGRRYLGDIVIAHETTAREARADGKPFAHHLTHLAVHGFLHLLGYDHRSDEEAEVMERREREILARLGVPDPYAMRDVEA